MPAPRILTGPTVTYSPNSQQSERLDRGYIVREIALQLTIEITTGASPILQGDILPGGIWEIVRKLRLKLNSNTNIRDISGSTLKLLNWFYYHNGDYDQEAPLILGTTSTATIVSTLVLPLWMVDSMKPIDTQLDATLLSNLELQVDWGDISDITGVANVSISADPYIEVGTLNTFGLKGPFNTQIITEQVYENIGVNPRYQVELATGNLYRSLLIGTQTAAGADAPGLIENIRIKSGGTDFMNVPASMWRNWSNRRERTFPFDIQQAETWVSDQRNLEAWFYVDLVTDGYLSETIRSFGMSELKLELEVGTAIDRLIVIPQEIIPLQTTNANGG